MPRPFASTALAFAVTLLAAASAANAQSEPPAGAGFAPPPAAAAGTGFGAAGQIVLSMGPTTGEHLFLHAQSGGNWQLQLSPALDYFLTAHLAVGGVIGFHYESAGAGTTVLTLGGRVSTNLDINDRFTFWPLAGLFYSHASANHSSSSSTVLRVFAPFLFHLAPHFFIGAGPSFDLGLSGGGNSYGIDSVLGGWF
jgi:hypothetical protein